MHACVTLLCLPQVPSPAFLASAVFQPCELCVEIKEHKRDAGDVPSTRVRTLSKLLLLLLLLT